MHEFSITQNLLDIALKKTNSRPIVRLNLRIGPFSEEREDAILFFWKDLAKGTPCEGTELHFEHALFDMKCLDCSGTFYLGEHGKDSVCRFCDSEHLEFLHGEDVRLESIEVA
jgi:Zn finger protein HypA/HybF involved in hydrogenase expression